VSTRVRKDPPAVYVAFHAAGTADPRVSDIRYYNLLKAWNASAHHPIQFIDSHRLDGSASESALRERLTTRLARSDLFLLIITARTRRDDDWVPWEVACAVDRFQLPIVCAYPEVHTDRPRQLRRLWPRALAERVGTGVTRPLHLPFTLRALGPAIAAARLAAAD